MKSGIHPQYVDHRGGLRLRQHLHHPQHRDQSGTIHVEVCSNCHPFYTGKQKILDTGGRVARFEARYGKRSRSRLAPRRRPPTGRTVGGRRCLSGRDDPGSGCTDPRGVPAMSDPGTTGAVADAARRVRRLEQQLADPAVHADQTAARRLGPPVRRADPDRAHGRRS